ncbi:trypsin-like serine protease [Amycolatopsis japonica]|uniref:trypsin-like serine protease n=1 Tax=Amycolatopsis japonica TaxID=208439 RepID=UPI0036704E0C
MTTAEINPEMQEPYDYYQQALLEMSSEPLVTNAAGETPWIASLMVNCDEPKIVDSFRGAGVLIDPRWVLTCGHAFEDYDRPEEYPKYEDLDPYFRIGGQRLGTGEVHRFDKVVTNRLRFVTDRTALWGPVNDIALARLCEPADAEPMRIKDFRGLRIGDRVRGYGWPGGKDGDHQLKQADTEVIPPQACIGGGPGTGDACIANVATAPFGPGYSGGPVFLIPQRETVAEPILAGVISRGAGSYGDQVLAGIVTDVTAHLSFIEKTIASTE